MTSFTFDALAYFERLKAAGVPEAQARIQAEAQSAIIKQMMEDREKSLPTRADLKEMELRLLKWQIGGWIALATIMAQGFGWPGF